LEQDRKEGAGNEDDWVSIIKILCLSKNKRKTFSLG